MACREVITMARNAEKHIFGSEALAAHGLVWVVPFGMCIEL